jgi:hypothetical protein
MPVSLLSDDEFEDLLSSIVAEGGWPKIEKLLRNCHVIESSTKDFFLRDLAYRGFKLFIVRFEYKGDTVTAADVQFSRPSSFPSALLNRNRPMVRKIVNILERLYAQKVRSHPFSHLLITQDRVKDENRWEQVHFGADVPRSASASFEEWGSECAVYDEHCSPGQVEVQPGEAAPLKDFIIIRFRRKAF